MNEKNLIQNIKRTPSERRENAQKAGIASGKARRQKRTFMELAKILLSVKVGKDEYKKLSQEFIKELKKEDKDIDIDNKTYMLLKQIQKAKDGDTKAFEVVRDTAGEAPITKTQQEITVQTPIQIIDDVDEDTKPEVTD